MGNAFPKRLTCPVVLFLLKTVSEGEASSWNWQFGGRIAQNKLSPARSAGSPRAGRLNPTEVSGFLPLLLVPHPAAPAVHASCVLTCRWLLSACKVTPTGHRIAQKLRVDGTPQPPRFSSRISPEPRTASERQS